MPYDDVFRIGMSVFIDIFISIDRRRAMMGCRF